MLVVNSREFRQNQRKYFDQIDQGEELVIQIGKDKFYTLKPIDEYDVYFNEAMVPKIKESMLEAKQGMTIDISTSEDIANLLGL